MAKGTELKIKRKITSREKNEFLWGWAFILPTMIGLIVLNIYPIIKTIIQDRRFRKGQHLHRPGQLPKSLNRPGGMAVAA